MNNLTVARFQRIGLGVVLALGLLDAWRYLNYQANPDGVSYLDLAHAFAGHGPAALINGYWSPLFPAVIGIAYRVFPPTVDTMYPIAHLVSFAVFVLATLLFHRFLTAARLRIRALSNASARSQLAVVVIGWCAYALFVLKGIGVQLLTPDVGVAAIVFWLAAESLALDDGPWPARRWVLTGSVLAIGYWWKAILMPVGAAWFAAAALMSVRRGDPMRGPAAGALAYAALALVLMIPVSLNTGRVTFGEAARLNYLWYVNAAPYVWERCLPPSVSDAASLPFGAIARSEVIAERPITCVISSPLENATIPLWDDPSRFYRDAHVRLDVTRQLRAIRNNVSALYKETADLGPILFGFATLLAFGAGVPVARRQFMSGAAVGPGAMALGVLIAAPVVLYLLVYVEFRHLAPFFTLAIVLAACHSLEAWRHRGPAVVLALAGLAAIDVVVRLSPQTLMGMVLARGAAMGREPDRIPVTQAVARALIAAGLAPRTRVAVINAEWNTEWAQLAGLRIRAHVPERTSPITHVLRDLRDDCIRAKWDDALRAQRIEAVVARIPVGLPPPSTFQALAGTAFHLHRVPAQSAAPAGCASAPPV